MGRLVEGFPTTEIPPSVSRDDLIAEGRKRFRAREKRSNEHDVPIRQEAQGGGSRLTARRPVPLRYPDYQSGAQQWAMLREVEDLVTGETDRASVTRTFI